MARQLWGLSLGVVKSIANEASASTWRSMLGTRAPWLPAPGPEQQRFKYAIRAPWPQPNPHAPSQLPPSVLHLPATELDEFRRVTMARLRRTLRERSAEALCFAARNPEIPAISDDKLVTYMTETLFSRSMSAELEPAELELLGPLAQVEGALYKLDSSLAALIEPLPGTFVANTTTYFVRRQPGARYEALAIALPETRGPEPLLLRPRDGPAWELAKHFAVQGSIYTGLFGTHPLVHFPNDAINALTKAILPPTHPLARLLLPHFYIQLCLDFSVMFIDKSPLHNNQVEFFTGLTNDGPASPLAMVVAVYGGADQNPSYPAYRWHGEPAKLHSDYGDFIAGYYRIIRDFVAEVLVGVAPDDPHVHRWLRECARHVRGFPGHEACADRELLIGTVAYIICNCAVIHSVDHYSFGTVPLLEMSLRMRVPPPNSRNIPALDRAAFTTLEDRFRLFLTHEMHIRPSTHVRLTEVDYGFDEPRRRAAHCRFVAALERYDADPGTTRHAPLSEIASSIQY